MSATRRFEHHGKIAEDRHILDLRVPLAAVKDRPPPYAGHRIRAKRIDGDPRYAHVGIPAIASQAIPVATRMKSCSSPEPKVGRDKSGDDCPFP